MAKQTDTPNEGNTWKSVLSVMMALIILGAPLYYTAGMMADLKRDVSEIKRTQRADQSQNWTVYHQSLFTQLMRNDQRNRELGLVVPNTTDIVRQMQQMKIHADTE